MTDAFSVKIHFLYLNLDTRFLTSMDGSGARSSQSFDLGPEYELRFEAGSSSIRIEVRRP